MSRVVSDAWAKEICADIKVVVFDKNNTATGNFVKSYDQGCFNKLTGRDK